jgi:hypothetical protein
MKKVNILIIPGGYECGIEIFESLKNKKNINIFLASSLKKDIVPFLGRKNFKLPNINNTNFTKKLNELIKKKKIDYIYPSHPKIIFYLNSNRKKILSKIILNEENVINKLKFKHEYLKIFRKENFYIKAYEDINKIEKFPVFIKPTLSYGSKGTKIVKEKSDLKNLNLNKFLIQEFVKGREYTVDCLCDHNGKLIYINARERLKIRIGSSFYCTDSDEYIQKKCRRVAKKILSKIKIKGAWFFQIKINQRNQIKLLEIENRIGGTMSFSRAKGINLPYLNFLIYNEQKIQILNQNFKISLAKILKPLVMYKDLKYKNVYLDLDDCLINPNKKINVNLINFIYQSINMKKKIILISKSKEKNKVNLLKKLKIYNIFDEIIWLKERDKKFKFIKKNSIFIDDSFSQRLEVYKKLKIKTFDPEMLI